ncbi:MAG: hypothetical protein E7328_01355 [Clostridiales bacterium]|nr:hypothetical protein [Clostridiales bacterium]
MLESRIIIKKAERKLLLCSAGEEPLTFPIALGKDPVGHKEREGDNKTPEGTYYICIRNENSKFYRSLGISYPNKADADAALLMGSITKEDHANIHRAHEDGRHPPFDTPLGGSIFIHGGGTDGDWTAGCVAAADAVMDVLFLHCPIGTPVTILP